MTIHPTAIIDSTACIGENVSVGPFSLVGPHCVVGEGTKLASHVVLESHVVLGKNNQVSSGAVLGGAPQDLSYGGEEAFVEIGDNVVIRECVTINRATGKGQKTRVGEGCFLMAYSHLGHNCVLGEKAILANNVQLGGYVEVGDNAFLGGTTVFHQFVKVGRLAIVSGFSGTRQDIPPFSMSAGCPADIAGINKIGLRRQGYSTEDRTRLRKVFNLIWFSQHNTSQGIEAVRQEFGTEDPLINELLIFIEASKRGVRRPEVGNKGQEQVKEPVSLKI